MNTASTIATNAFGSYSSTDRTIQRQAQTHYYQQQQHPSLHQEQLHEANRQTGALWERQHQELHSATSGNDCTPMPQQISDRYYPLYSSTAVQNCTPRNIKTEDEPLLFVGSAAKFPKMTTNNKHGNGSSLEEDDGYLNLIKERSSSPSKKHPNHHKHNKNIDQDDMHEDERLTYPTENVVERKRYRRESHNAVERRRRNNINDNIRSLGLLLPENMCQGKLNKGTILQGSVMYIHMLNDQLSKYKERLEQLNYEAAALNPSLLRSTTSANYSHAQNQQM